MIHATVLFILHSKDHSEQANSCGNTAPQLSISLLCASLVRADSAPLTTKGMHQSSMRMSQPQGASHISMSLAQPSTSPWAPWALCWAITIPASLHILLCTTVCEEKIQPYVPDSYSDFIHPADLPLLFLAVWQTLSCCAWVSCLTIPASPTLSPWEGEGGACWMVAEAARGAFYVIIPQESQRQRHGLLVLRLQISSVGADLLEERVTHETPTNANLAFVWYCLTLMNNGRVRPAVLFI